MTGRSLELTPSIRYAIEQALGETIKRSNGLRWGTGTPTTVLDLASGRRLVVQALGHLEAARIQRVAAVLRDGGLPSPRIELVVPARGRTFVVFEALVGVPGPEQLATHAATGMAAAMGGALGTLRRVRGPALPIDHAWMTPRALRTAADRWLAAIDHDRAAAAAVAPHVARLVSGSWLPVLSHGDYVPANALLEGGRLVALVDLADLAFRHPLVDPAWWLLIVRHHHIRALPTVEEAFLAGGLDGLTGSDRRDLASVAVVRALQRLARASAESRSHHRDLLKTALVWARDQPT